MSLTVPHLPRLLLVPGGAGAELHTKLHPRQSNPQEIIPVICSSKPWPLTLFAGSKFNYPSPCPPPVHSREGKTLSGWHWNVRGCCRAQQCLLEPPPSCRTTFLSCSRDSGESSSPAPNSLAQIHQNQNANWLCNNIMACQEETFVSLK